MEYIKHVGRYVSSSRNASYEARSSVDKPLEAAQTHGRDTNVECGAVIKLRCAKADVSMPLHWAEPELYAFQINVVHVVWLII